MRINYCYSAQDIDHPERGAALRARMRRAGVDTLWLLGCFSGRPCASREQLTHAAEVLKGEGFDVGAVTIPVGAPGQLLKS